ncbi:hypothetical protein BVRB_9g222040 [Beta vulgaris subsp. vulgaris]|nr:hypothetical protein BVRB_9g222040 [Beta vulgaris subsp. vulgaris]
MFHLVASTQACCYAPFLSCIVHITVICLFMRFKLCLTCGQSAAGLLLSDCALLLKEVWTMAPHYSIFL